MFPDAWFYIPFFLIIILLNIKKTGIKRFFVSLILPIVLLGIYGYLEFILPLRITGLPNATYEHLFSRRAGMSIVFNIKEFFFGYITNFSVFLTALFLISLVLIIIFRVKRIIKFNTTLFRLYLLFFLHFFFWMFLTPMENGHLMHSFPIILFTVAFAYDSFLSFTGNRDHIAAKNKRKILLPVYSFLVILICLVFYHTFILFNSLSLDKEKYPLFYNPGYVPAGYATGHKVGIKSAAYLLRKDKSVGEELVSHYGVGFNFIYMGGDIIPYHSSNAIELMKAGEDVYRDYRIRFISISPDFYNKEYLEYIDSQGFDKLIVEHDNKEIFYVYDIINKNNEIIIIDRDQYDRDYIREYSHFSIAQPHFSYY
jgi:hypothetical protein